MRIDKFGRPHINKVEELINLLNMPAYKVDDTGNVTYICYEESPRRIIRRITVEGTVTTIEFSYGKWEDRTTLTYVPINSSIEVPDL